MTKAAIATQLKDKHVEDEKLFDYTFINNTVTISCHSSILKKMLKVILKEPNGLSKPKDASHLTIFSLILKDSDTTIVSSKGITEFRTDCYDYYISLITLNYSTIVARVDKILGKDSSELITFSNEETIKSDGSRVREIIIGCTEGILKETAQVLMMSDLWPPILADDATYYCLTTGVENPKYVIQNEQGILKFRIACENLFYNLKCNEKNKNPELEEVSRRLFECTQNQAILEAKYRENEENSNQLQKELALIKENEKNKQEFIKQLSRSLTEKNQETSDKDAEISALKHDITLLTKSEDEITVRLESYKTKHDKLLIHSRTFENQIKQKQDTIDKKNIEITNMRDEYLEKLEALSRGKLAELVSIKRELEECNSNRATLEKNIDNLKFELENFYNQIKQKQDTIDQNNIELIGISSKYLAEIESLSRSKEVEISSIRQKLEKCNSNQATLEKNNNELESKLQTQTEENQRLRHLLKEEDIKLTVCEQTIESQTAQISELQIKTSLSTETLNQLNDRIVNYTKENADLLAERNSLQQKLADQQLLDEKMQKTKENLLEKHESILTKDKNKIDKIMQELTKCSNNQDTLTLNYQTSALNSNRMNKQIRKLQTEIDLSRESKQQVDSTSELYKKQCSEQTEITKSKNLEIDTLKKQTHDIGQQLQNCKTEAQKRSFEFENTISSSVKQLAQLNNALYELIKK